jgi:hypothetical protein
VLELCSAYSREVPLGLFQHAAGTGRCVQVPTAAGSSVRGPVVE